MLWILSACSPGVTFADHAATSEVSQDEAQLQALLAMVPDGFGLGDVRELRVVWGAINWLLALHGQAQKAPTEPAQQRYRQKIGDVCRWIDGRLAEPLKLDEVASQFGLSRSLLTREFRRHTAKSCVDYCNSRRVEKAAIRLVSANASLTSVALDSGFANLSHFHRQFKDCYGQTPAAFRRRILGMVEHD
jgi:AraC-like DNA-binding protein